ncbi:MAG: hypothetical protein JWL77_5565 [Chthonomonadaceae bacterium]|nr:hypothetical protein [Chthonomonadaceae bacterium]
MRLAILRHLLDAGAEHVIVTGDEGLVARVKEITGDKGADLIFDPIAGDTLPDLASGKLKPIVAKTFPLQQIQEAHQFLESNQQLGKVVVTV